MKCGEIISVCSKDVGRNGNSDINQGCNSVTNMQILPGNNLNLDLVNKDAYIKRQLRCHPFWCKLSVKIYPAPLSPGYELGPSIRGKRQFINTFFMSVRNQCRLIVGSLNISLGIKGNIYILCYFFKRRADCITLSLENKASQQNAFIPYITRSIIGYSIYRKWVRTSDFSTYPIVEQLNSR